MLSLIFHAAYVTCGALKQAPLCKDSEVIVHTAVNFFLPLLITRLSRFTDQNKSPGCLSVRLKSASTTAPYRRLSVDGRPASLQRASGGEGWGCEVWGGRRDCQRLIMVSLAFCRRITFNAVSSSSSLLR